jgi:hypothetical protein
VTFRDDHDAALARADAERDALKAELAKRPAAPPAGKRAKAKRTQPAQIDHYTPSTAPTPASDDD